MKECTQRPKRHASSRAGTPLSSGGRSSTAMDSAWETTKGEHFWKSLRWLAASAVFSALGNSLDAVSVLEFASLFSLSVGLYSVAFFNQSSKAVVWLLSFLLVSQSLASGVGFSGVFASEARSWSTFTLSLGFSFLIWTSLLLFSILPLLRFLARFPTSSLCPLVLPATHTVVLHLLFGAVTGVFPSPANAFLDLEPLRQVASIIGIAGVNFAAVFPASYSAAVYLRKTSYSPTLSYSWLRSAQYRRAMLMLLSLFAVGGLIARRTTFFQRDVAQLLRPTVSVSCVAGQSPGSSSAGVWAAAMNRVQAGDRIVLTTEAALIAFSDEEERELLLNATAIGRAGEAYLGIAYLKVGEQYTTNQFALVSPGTLGRVVWNYAKAFPVPGVEGDVRAGLVLLPTHTDPLLGTLGGAICFDLDHPDYLRQAADHGVDIMLQPSWYVGLYLGYLCHVPIRTWGSIGTRHFEGNAVRALEGGFTLLRCSSDGISGIVGPTGVILARSVTGHDPAQPLVFTLPLTPRLRTVYADYGGYLFLPLCAAFSAGVWIAALLPVRWLLSPQLRTSAAEDEELLPGPGYSALIEEPS